MKQNSVKQFTVDSIIDNFDDVYLMYYPRLCRFANEYLCDYAEAENIVQSVFLKVWENREKLIINVSLMSYLFCLVKNRCIDQLRRKVVSKEYCLEIKYKLEALVEFDHHFSSEEDIERVVSQAIATLPEKCREIFIKNRVQGKKYAEIAEELDISVSTVKNQVSIALKKLRVQLAPYLPLLFLF